MRNPTGLTGPQPALLPSPARGIPPTPLVIPLNAVGVLCPQPRRIAFSPPLPSPCIPSGATTHIGGDGWGGSVTAEMPPAHQGQMPTPLASS